MEELLRVKNQTLNNLRKLSKQKEEIQRDKIKAQDELKNAIYNPFRTILKEFNSLPFRFDNMDYELIDTSKSLAIRRENRSEVTDFIEFVMRYNQKEIEELFLLFIIMH